VPVSMTSARETADLHCDSACTAAAAMQRSFSMGLAARPTLRKADEFGPDLSDFAPDIAAFYAYWDGKRRGRNMPARANIDPLEMVPFLPGIVLIDVVADARRFVYRLVGTREVAMRGRDPTGKSVAEGFYAPRPLLR
jgi:hypothetical protein